MARGDGAGGRRAALSRLASLALLALAPGARAQGGAAAAELPRIDDLRRLAAQMRRERVPLLLFFSTPGCPYCVEVRRSYLVPRLKDRAEVLIREVETVSRRSFVGLDGKPHTEAALASRFGVRAVPVVQLVDASMQPTGAPLVGIDAAGFYDAYLAAAIDEARLAMRAR